jgi:DNA helicase IV
MSTSPPDSDQLISELIDAEEACLGEINYAVDAYAAHRLEQIKSYHTELNSLKKERLETVSWHEKNKITQKLVEKEAYNPASFLPEFHQVDTPYFASFSIVDDNPKIGRQRFLLGKQNLFKENKVVIIDWRQSAISSLYYEYESGDEYDEDINGTERTGILTDKRRYTIKVRSLFRIETDDLVVEKRDGEWQKSGDNRPVSTAARKEEAADHHLCDIVSLISPEQFHLITKKYHGCLRLQGSAGAGKTTIALHRLSYLVYNYPAKFRQEKCMVLMFNRVLRDYVAAAVDDMLGPKTVVETFHSWAAMSLRGLGLKKISFTTEVPSQYDMIKKSSGMAALVAEYAETAENAVAIEHLFRMYSSKSLTEKHLASDFDAALLQSFRNYYSRQLSQGNSQKNSIGFSDAGVLLRLFQIRTLEKNPQASNPALNYFDHLVIDEAQDFSQIELECLFNAATEERSITICADPNQQILHFIDSSGLDNFQLNLQKKGISSEELTVSYRSTKEIMVVANNVLGLDKVEEGRSGEPVFFGQYRSKEDALVHLARRVEHEQSRSPNGLIAVICKHKSEIDQLYRKLRAIPGVRKDPRRFQPGVLITNAHQVKGLEFTSVIVWNATQKSYNESKADRNLLYVVASRACDRLAVLCYDNPSQYIQKFFATAPLIDQD